MTLTCKCCGVGKDESEFYRRPYGSDKPRNRCKVCYTQLNRTDGHRAASRKWNRNNKAKKAAIFKVYAETERGRELRRLGKVRQRARLTAKYVAQSFTNKTTLTINQVPDVVIEAARALIKLKRIVYGKTGKYSAT